MQCYLYGFVRVVFLSVTVFASTHAQTSAAGAGVCLLVSLLGCLSATINTMRYPCTKLKLAGYSALLVVDGGVDSISKPTFECSSNLLQTSVFAPAHQSTAGKNYIVFHDNFQKLLEFAQPQTLHLDSHGGFAALVSVQIDTSTADQTILSFVGDQGAHIKLHIDVTSASYTFTVADNSGATFSVHSAAGSAPAGVQQTVAVQFARHAHEMDIILIDAVLTMTPIATPESRDAAVVAVCPFHLFLLPSCGHSHPTWHGCAIDNLIGWPIGAVYGALFACCGCATCKQACESQ